MDAILQTSADTLPGASGGRPARRLVRCLLAALLLIAVGLSAVVLPWQVVLLGVTGLSLIAWGVLDVRIALAVLMGLAYILQPDTNGKGVRFEVLSGLFAQPEMISFPLLYLGVGALFAFVHVWGPRGIWWHRPVTADPCLPPVLLLLGYALLGLTWSPNLNVTVPWVLLFAVNVAVYRLLVVRLVAGGWAAVLRLIWITVWIGVLYCSISVVSYFFPPLPNLEVPLTGSIRLFISLAGGALTPLLGWPRQIIGGYHVMNAITNLLLASALGLLLIETHRRRRIGLALVAVLFAYVTVFTDARGSFWGLLGMLVFLVFALQRFRRRAGLWLGVALASVVFFVWFSTSLVKWVTGHVCESRSIATVPVLNRFFGSSKGETYVQSADLAIQAPVSRAVFWAISTREFWTTEGVGHGAGNEMFIYLPPNEEGGGGGQFYTHNVFFSIIVDFGVVGVLFLVWFAAVFLRQLSTLLRRPESATKTLALVLCGSLVSIAVNGLAFFTFNDPFIWCQLGLTQAAIALALRAGDGAGAERPDVLAPA